ncbi:MAG TPA: glycosyltransferase family 2 protein [Candidatus Eisenbacteria bacterium]|nr:glycosyltransferase family 2 protein [Candidatus Eisenbacteria bacterium]
MQAVSAPSVSIIIPCRNEADHIEACLRSILAQDADGLAFEVIVADGMSDDGTREILRRLAAEDPRLIMIDNPQQIVSTGLNLGIRSARGEVVLRMDVHTEYASDYLRQCLKVLEESGADNVGGPWVARGKGYVGRTIAATFQSPFAVGGSRAHAADYEGPVDTVYLGCWKRDVFKRVGFFDEELVRNQDDEFNLRLVRAGGKIWQSPRIKSWYTARGSLGALFRQYMQYGYWKVRVIQKHRMPASVMYLVPGVFVFTLLLLSAASIFLPLARYGLALTASAYVGALSIASVVTAVRSQPSFLFLLPVVFACFHFGFGIGFLHGVLDFLVLRRGPRAQFAALTRQSPASRGNPAGV